MAKQITDELRWKTIQKMQEALEALENAPCKEAPRWISPKDKLPENRTYVLASIHAPGRQPHVRSGWYEDNLFMNDNGDTWKSTDIEVKAWMPLPEPYKEG